MLTDAPATVAGLVHSAVLVGVQVPAATFSGAHQFIRVGRLAFVGGMCGAVMDVAPYTIVNGTRAEVSGLNTIGMQRAGMTEEQVGRVKQAFKLFFRSGLQAAEALAKLEAELGSFPEVAHFVAFVKGSKRGVTR